MQLKCYNRALVLDREKTYLSAAAAAAATSLTVISTDLAPAGASSDTWADNDYMIVGEIGQEGTEVMQMSAAVTSATTLSIDREGSAGGLRFAHPIGTPIYRIDFNRVEFCRSLTDTSVGNTVLATIRIQPDDEFTRYEDTGASTGFGFARFNNQTTGAFSSYSDGVNYESTGISSSRDPRTLWMMRKKVRQLLDETEPGSKLTDDMIENALNDKQRDIAHMRLWTFYENERSLSSVADQFAYTIPSTVQLIHGIRYDSIPLGWISKAEWDITHANTSSTSNTPTGFNVWNGSIIIFPTPASSAQTTTLTGAHTAATTTIIVAATTGFNRGDYYRIVIDSEVIFATAITSTTFTGCLRGQEGTTAATHAGGATVTERDIVYTCHVEPSDLVDTQDRTSIPEPDILPYGAAIDLAPYVGKKDLMNMLEVKYKIRYDDLKTKYSSKQSMQHGRIKDMYERNVRYSAWNDTNRFPQSI